MLERELARGQRGGRARARARDVRRRIAADVPSVPVLPRASQNVAAAAAIFQNLPEPDTPEGRQAHYQVRQLLERAALQHAETATQPRGASSRRTPGASTRGSVQNRLGGRGDLRPTLDARQTDVV